MLVPRNILGNNFKRLLSGVKESISAAPKSTTGIEHADAFKQTGLRHKQDFKDYKCSEYLNFNKWSFYDKEVDMMSHRVSQPTNKKPDVAPKVTVSS
uniref:NADH dehydrogenase [ubiquinone] flavoprotein 3, mitochondrial n=1 Tax=Strongyloides papillosus TaxID=174720 RepID=A0A0N5BKE9_STREA